MTLQDWWSLLTRDPDDWDTRLAFADWLNDQGELVLERGQRWQVQHQKFPSSCPYDEWTWFVTLGNRNDHDDLERWIFTGLQSPKRVCVTWRDYDSLAQAERDLAQALRPGD